MLCSGLMQWIECLRDFPFAEKGYSAEDVAHSLELCEGLLDRLLDLEFSIKRCLHCGEKFEASNPRKATCSDACRKAMSRSKCP